MTGYIPAPDGLYTPATLFDGFDVDDAASWTRTTDARAYRGFVQHGKRMPDTPEDARAQAEHDVNISSALAAALKGRRPVAIMGGHQMDRGDPGYEAVARIARSLTRQRFLVLTGGGPGAMEAAHLGARLAGLEDSALAWAMTQLGKAEVRAFPVSQESELIANGEFVPTGVARLHAWQVPAFTIAQATADAASDSIGIPTWLYGHEPPTPLATRLAKYFANSIREDGLLALATYGVIYAPGSAGTLQEIFQDAAQNYYRSVDNVFSPMIFIDTGQTWTADFAVDTALKRLFRPEDYGSLVTFVQTADEAVQAVLSRVEVVDRQIEQGRSVARPTSQP